jgi:hypothetical protein
VWPRISPTLRGIAPLRPRRGVLRCDSRLRCPQAV